MRSDLINVLFTRSDLIRYNNSHMARIKLVTDQIYHVYNRGTDKRQIFLDDQDHLRFIHNLFEFNDANPALNTYYRNPYEIGSHKIIKDQNRTLVVEILTFCLMPNHFHLLLRQKRDRGISQFMQKLGVGYAMYFNQKYKRTGSLFQGKFKAVPVITEAHFIHLPYYIHLNPLDLYSPEWRERKLKNFNESIKFLEKYRWSSHLDYLGEKNFSAVTERKFLLDYFEGSSGYQNGITRWLKDLKLNSIQGLTLE